MKPKSMFYLSFFLVLYIAPMIFTMSYDASTIPTEQNTTKDFSIASAWLTGWEKRKTITITGSVGASTNYAVNFTVTFEAGMQADFGDIRFTDNDGYTLLDYWLEFYTASTSAKFWVEVKDDLDSNQIIYMYFENGEAEEESDAKNVFPFYDGFEGVFYNFEEWDVVGAVWDQNLVNEKNGFACAFGDSASTGRSLEKTVNITYDVCFHSWVYLEDSVGTGANTYIVAPTTDSLLYTDANDATYYNGTKYYYAENVLSIGVWYEFELTWDVSTKQTTFVMDGIEKNTMTTVTNNITNLRVLTDSSVNIDFYIDDYYFRKWTAIEPSVSIGEGYETPPGEEWNDIIEVELLFTVPVDETALNWMLVFLGLCMIPASTLYLVKGGKDNLSMNKVFFFLVAFMLGWAIFLGGIYG